MYNGDFLNNKKHGDGLILLSNGDKYEGSFANDQFEGEGAYTDVEGNITNGQWNHGNKI